MTKQDNKESLRIHNKFFRDWYNNHKYIYRRFGINKLMRILDIGCGAGHNLIHFNKDSIGIDNEDYMINYGRKLGLNIKKLNVEDELIKDRGFDLVWCSDFIPHLVSPYRFLMQIRQCVGSGLLLIQTPQISIFKTYDDQLHFYAFNKKALTYLLEISGYKIIDYSGYIRRLPNILNKILEKPLQSFGSNIWILAKLDKIKETTYKTHRPLWF